MPIRFAEDEKRVGALISERWPHFTRFLNSEVLPVFREVERLMTSAMNAYVAPKVSAYVLP